VQQPLRFSAPAFFPFFLIHLISFISSLVAPWGSVPERTIPDTRTCPNSRCLVVAPVPGVTVNAVGCVTSCVGPCRHRMTLYLTFPTTLCRVIGETGFMETRGAHNRCGEELLGVPEPTLRCPSAAAALLFLPLLPTVLSEVQESS